MKTFIRIGVVAGIVCASMMGCALEGGTPEGTESALNGGNAGVGPSDAASPVVMDATAVVPLPPRPACYAGGGGTPSNLTGPAAHQNKCGSAEIAAFRDACMAGIGTPACVALRRSAATCSACILGATGDINDHDFMVSPTHPMGVLLIGAGNVNTMGCAALASERYGCGWPLSMQQSCIESKCSKCDVAGDKDACRAHARVDGCAQFELPDCTGAMRLRKSVWEPICIGATPGESFTKVATFMCGAP